MEILFNKKDGITIFAIKGRLDTSNYETASKEIDKRIAEGEKLFIADLSEMDYISSSGLRVFLSVLKKLKSEGGNIVLCCIQPKIKEVFEISGFNSLFTLTQSVEEGLEEIK